MGIGKIGIQVYRFVKVCNSEVQISFVAVSTTAIVIGFGKIGF